MVRREPQVVLAKTDCTSVTSAISPNRRLPGSLRRTGQARGSLPFAYCFSNVKLSLTSAAGNVPAFPVKEYVPAPALPGIL